ncbi:polysaccharide biosynthesis C-terminal domain-containing protein [Acinetobacter sp. 197]|uniref:polysaccharide biosynthesis C-terminal domain-containing protein n=1 Tax=Acinetobacter sp. 197 TaxID=3114696 RepID=UPI003A87EC37
MKSILNILNRAKWLLGGNLIFSLSQWLIMIMIARLASKENLGQYALALAIVLPIYALTNLQLRPLFILDDNGKRKYNYSNFYYLRLLSSFIGILICIIFGFYYNEILLILLIVAGIKFLESLSDIIYAFYNSKDKTYLISKSLLLKGMGGVLACFLGLTYFNFNWAIFFILLNYFLIWYFLDNKFILKTKEISQKKLNFKILNQAIPMGVTLGLVTLQSSIPRIFLNNYESTELVGILSVLSYFVVIGSIFINSICQYLSPKIVKFWINDIKGFIKNYIFMQVISLLFGFFVLFFCYFFGNIILNLVYGEKFIEYGKELNLIMFSGIFLYLSTVNGFTLTSIGYIGKQVYIFSFIVLTTLLSSYILIPRLGIDGAIYSMVIAYFTQFIVTSLVIIYKLRCKTNSWEKKSG